MQVAFKFVPSRESFLGQLGGGEQLMPDMAAFSATFGELLAQVHAFLVSCRCWLPACPVLCACMHAGTADPPQWASPRRRRCSGCGAVLAPGGWACDALPLSNGHSPRILCFQDSNGLDDPQKV
jgi:hypothetical protein